MRAGSDVPFA